MGGSQRNRSRRPPRAGVAGGARVLALPPVVYLGTILVASLFQRLWPLRLSLPKWMSVGVGLALVGLGLLLLAWASRLLLESGQDPNPRTPTPSLIETGPYRYSRNPVYVGMTMILLGATLGLSNGWMLILTVPVMAVIHFGVVLPEERYLEGVFGEAYEAYRQRVRRWL